MADSEGTHSAVGPKETQSLVEALSASAQNTPLETRCRQLTPGIDAPDLFCAARMGYRVNTVVALGLEDEDKDKEQLQCTIASKTIGKGAHATIKKATIKGTNAKVKALKIMKRSSFEKWFQEEFNNQRKVLALKDAYKHIVCLDNDYHYKLSSMGKLQEDDQIAVMEFMKGGDLLSLLEKQHDSRFTEHRAKVYFNQMVDAIKLCHEAALVHLDIKPENFLLSANKQVVKLADFGESQYCAPGGTIPPTENGTRAYKAPEIIEGRRVGPPADIWSLGVTLYSLVFGRIPFEDDNVLSLYNKIRTQTVMAPEDSEVSDELMDLLNKMLIKRPQDRITLSDIKEHDWVTMYGLSPLLKEEENCHLIEVSEQEVQNSIRSIPKLDTLILVKAMLKQHSFCNPFSSVKDKFQKSGQSNSVPEEACDIYIDSRRQVGLSSTRLPSVSERSIEDIRGDAEFGNSSQEAEV